MGYTALSHCVAISRFSGGKSQVQDHIRSFDGLVLTAMIFTRVESHARDVYSHTWGVGAFGLEWNAFSRSELRGSKMVAHCVHEHYAPYSCLLLSLYAVLVQALPRCGRTCGRPPRSFLAVAHSSTGMSSLCQCRSYSRNVT